MKNLQSGISTDPVNRGRILEVIERHQTRIPVPVGAIAKSLGIEVYAAKLGNRISGILRKDEFSGPSGYSIVVNVAHHKNRQRFTVAHELAHFILHREGAGDSIEDDEFYRALSNARETEANRMAADILMPWHLINRLMHQGIVDLPTMAAKLQVSRQALAIRLELPYDQDWE